MSIPLVSVVMPSYNSEKHISESIQSIIDQTFTDWELIVVDGHSKDKTIPIVQSYIEKDSRIRLVFDKGNGLGAALHLGCLQSQGKYIARMDTDDISYPNRIFEQVSFLDKHDGVVVISCMAENINEDGEIIGSGITYTSKKILQNHYSLVCHPGVMMRKDIYFLTGGYPPLIRAEDLFLWHLFSKYGEIVIQKRILLKYRISEGALSSTTSDYFNDNVEPLWRIIAHKDKISEIDYNYMNHFISEAIVKYPNRKEKNRIVQDVMYSILKRLLPTQIAINICVLFKNIYGRVRY